MKPRFLESTSIAASLVLAMAVSMPAEAASPTDWSAISTQNVKLFYPGQSSLQWLRSKEHKRAFRKTLQGDSCVSCHEGEEEEIGQATVSGEKLEPHPIEGKQAVIDLAVQAAHDSENLYFRFQWKTRNPFPGTAHPHWRFDGKEWKAMGWPRLNSLVGIVHSIEFYGLAALALFHAGFHIWRHIKLRDNALRIMAPKVFHRYL